MSVSSFIGFFAASSNVDYQYAYKQTVWNTEVNWLDKFK